MLPSKDLDFIFEKIGSYWEFLRGKNIFITGGTGFFGIWLLESFVRANEALGLQSTAHVLTRKPSAFLRKCPHLGTRSDIVLHCGGIQDFQFPVGSFPLIIHAAADTSSRSSPTSSLQTFQTLLDGTRRVLDFALEASVEKFLFISSGAVYGTQPADLPAIPESYLGAPDPFSNASFYGEAKRACEWLCSSHARTYKYKMNSARCFSFVGPHLPLNGPYAIGNFIRDVLGGGAPRITGAGNAFRSYLYAADLAVWLWRILFTGSAGRAYNVGSDQEISICDLAALVSQVAKIETLFPSDFGDSDSRYIPDTTRARKDLSLECWIPLPEAIRRTMDWLTFQSSSDRNL